MKLELDTSLLSTSWMQQIEARLPRARQIGGALSEQQDMCGWFAWSQRHGTSLSEKMASVEKTLPSYDSVVVVGIGGSYLGVRAAQEALSHRYAAYDVDTAASFLPVFYMGNTVSELEWTELLDVLRIKNPIVVVVSKSGTTLEPTAAFKVILGFLQERYLQDQWKSRVVAVTDASSGWLRQYADQNQLPSFEIPDSVGGRFSFFTAVGMVPLFLARYPVSELIHGANTLFREWQENCDTHPILMHAAHRHVAWENQKSVETLSYSQPKLVFLIEWWKQLFGESEGKDDKGLFPAGLMYSTDLHSMGQYMQEGHSCMIETFLCFKNPLHTAASGQERRLRIPSSTFPALSHIDERYVEDLNKAAMQSAALAHAERGVPTVRMELEQMDAATLGYLFAYFQVLCGVSAGLLGVNPYDQPGVEAYKVKMKELMA